MRHHLRFFVAVLFAVYFVVTYILIRHYVVQKGIFYAPMFSWEQEIPFLPWTFFIYILVYVVPLAAFLLLHTTESLKAMFKSFFVGITVHQVFWIFYPVHFDLRPVIQPDSGNWVLKVADAFLNLDSPPVNCFPSLHVTYAFLSYFVLHVYRPRIAPLFLFFAIVISISTMTFKQHYLIDVVAGVILAFMLKLIFLPPLRFDRGLS